MRLKSIKLAGFKSFVDATTVSFPHNMTAIVGPNGCGKSNVIDAVRWVMGESSAKNLRGESMTDVIFNGSSARQPVGQASIELVFDNSSGKLSGEYAAFAEISIRRKVTREGQSQYYLNGSKCRRRDVTDIFLGTGMGPRSYAIIEQGMISRLIESKPEELRVYLEEAAGVSKYKERRRETENRIARTQENLERLSDIRDELAKQLAHLQRQARAAEKYRDYKQSQRLAQAKHYALQWQQLDEQARALKADILRCETAIEKAVLARTENEGLIENLRLSAEQEQEQFNAVQEKYYQSGAEVAKLEQELKYRQEREQQRTSALAKLALQRATLDERYRSTQTELAQSESQIELLQPDFELQQEQLEQLSEQLEQAAENLEAWQQQWDNFDERYQNRSRMRQSTADSMTQLKRSIDEKQSRLQRIETEHRELIEQIDEGSSQALLEPLAELEQQVAEFEASVAELGLLHDDSVQELEQLRERKQAKAQALAERQAVLASLETLQASALRQQRGDDQECLAEAGLAQASRLYQQISLDKRWEPAIEHVLGDFLNALCSDQQSLDVQVQAQLTQHLNLVAADASNHAQVAQQLLAGTLAEKVEGAWALQGLLASVRLADDFEQALELRAGLEGNASVITPEGVWLGRHWIRYYKPATEAQGLVSREQDISEAQSAIASLKDAVASIEVRLGDLQDQSKMQAQQQAQAQKSLRHALAERAKCLAEKSADDARNEQRKLRLARSAEDLEDLRERLAQEREQLEALQINAEEAAYELDDLESERERQLETKQRLQREREQLSQSLRQAQSALHANELQRQQQLNQTNILSLSLKRIEEDLARVIEEHEQIAEVEADDDDTEILAAQLEGLLDRRLSIEANLAQARTRLEQQGAQLREAEQARGASEDEVQRQRMALEQQRMQKQAMDINQAGFIERIEQEQLSLASVLDALQEGDTLDAIAQELDALAQRISRLGAINLAAVEEYQEQLQRKEYLDAQDAELCDALDTLLSAIRKIDKETRARFKATYEQVNEGLQRLFPRIFGGGSAHLELTDNDLLETGVAIIARPPGKKNSTIHLLSGGEKALTAIALIFAIFELNPAPFCMLDEVDAPLDDANVGRFANMVKHMSDRVQFIYISHNKVSMEKADQLMGVTMSEPGCSRLVSVNVDEAVSLAQA